VRNRAIIAGDMSTLIDSFRLIAASQVLLTGVVLWRAGGAPLSRGLTLALLICICSYLLIPVLVDVLPAFGVLLLDALASAIPGLLFVFAWHLFQDGRKSLPVVAWLLIILYMGAFGQPLK